MFNGLLPPFPTIIDGVSLQSLTLGENEKGMVRLYSIFGELVRTWKVAGGKNHLDMNALGISQGVYVYVVEVEGVVKRKDKLVKLN